MSAFHPAAAITAITLASVLTVAVPSAQTPRSKRVLLFTHNVFLTHDNGKDIEDVVPELGRAGGFTVTSLHGYEQTIRCTLENPCGKDAVDLSIVTKKYLSQFDGLVMAVNGELPFSDEA